jgi:drug/metabolite transporter (DMT)-like permease
VKYAALGVVYVVWGSTYLAIRLTIETMPPLLSGGLRFLIAGAVLAGVVALVSKGSMRMTRAQFGTAALLGFLLPAWGNGLVVVAEQQVSSGLAALLIASVPLYVVVLRASTGDRPPPITYVGVAIGLVGLAVLVLLGETDGGTHGSAWWGPWLVLLASLGWSVGTLLSGKLPKPANPFALSAVEMLVGGSVMTVGALLTGERVSFGEVTTTSWLAWGYLVVFGSLLAFSSYVYVLGQLPVSTVATYAYVNPVIAVLLGVVIADEHFGAVQFLGGALVLVAVVLVVNAERKKVPELSRR